jgi:hypothetical protein
MYIQTKRIVLSTLFAALLLGSVAMPAQAQFGVAAGLNFETADDINTSSGDDTFENATGYHLGVVYDAAAGPLKVRPGLLYRQVGEYEFGGGRTEIERFEVPVDLKFTLPVPLVTPYLLGGPMAVFPRVEDAFGDDFKDVSYSLNIGVGASISLGEGATLQPELRYEYGINEYTEDEGDLFEDSDDGPRFQGVALRLHATF